MPQPLLKDRDRHSAKHAVAAVGVAEGVGPGGIYADIYGGSLHRFPDSLACDVQHGAISVLGVERGQVGQALQEIRGDRNLAALAGLVPWDLRPDADDRRVLVEPKVATAQGEGLGDAEPGPEHDPEGHTGGI